MSIGLGIFLGSVFLGIIFLYTKTRGSWNWPRISKVVGLSIAGVVGLIALPLGAYFGYLEWEKRPRLVTSLDGATLGEPLSDVVFRHGPLTKNPPTGVQKYSDEEYYQREDNSFHVSVRGGRITSIWHDCKTSDNRTDYTTVNGIQCGDLGNKIMETLGDNLRVLCTRDKVQDIAKLFRAYDVPKYGTRYLLVLNQVRGFYIFPPGELESLVGYNWDKCE